MKKKIEVETNYIKAGIVILMLVLVAVSNVTGVTRTISGTIDNIESFIRNSNGKYWSATANNLQSALDDLTDGGIVYYPNATISFTNTITMNENTTIQGVGYNSVIDAPDSAKTLINLNNNCKLEDLKILGTSDIQTPIVIDDSNCHLDNIWVHGGGGFHMIEITGNHIYLDNIKVENGSDYSDGWCAGIHVDGQGSPDPSDIYINNFYIDDCDRGIEIENRVNDIYVTNGYVNDVPAGGSSPLYSIGCHGHPTHGYNNHIVFKNIYINNSAGFNGGYKCTDVTFDNIKIENIIYARYPTIYDSSQIVQNSYFNGNNLHANGYLLAISNGGGKVKHCIFDNISEYFAIYNNGGDYVTIDDCIFTPNATAGNYALRIDTNTVYAKIINNFFIGDFGTSAVYLREINDGVFSNNFVDGDNVYIYQNSVDNLIMTENFIDGTLTISSGNTVFCYNNDFTQTTISDSSNSIFVNNAGYNESTYLIVPDETTALERFLRYDDTNNQLEVYDDSTWVEFNPSSIGGDYDPTKIYVSNGNNYTASASNLQTAINSLNNASGTVKAPAGTYTFTSTLQIWEHITVIAYGAKFTTSSDINVVQMHPYSQLIGCEIITSGYGQDYTKAGIYLDGDDEFNTWKSCLVSNVQITGSISGWDYANNGSAIEINCSSYATVKNCYSAHFTDIWARNFKYGVYLHSGKYGAGEGGACNGNIFTDLTIHQCKYGIYIKKYTGGGGTHETDGNQFKGYMIQPYASWKVEDVHCEGSYNVLDGFCYDASGTIYNLTSTASHNRVQEGGAMTIASSQYVDDGTYNAVWCSDQMDGVTIN